MWARGEGYPNGRGRINERTESSPPGSRTPTFSGEGARLYGGRWSRKGVALVYTAQSQSLAMLEMLIQDAPLRAHYVLIQARIPQALKIERLNLQELPLHWRGLAARQQLQAIGTRWARKGGSAVLAVPSAVVPDETNYLLNPLHAEFRRIEKCASARRPARKEPAPGFTHR